MNKSVQPSAAWSFRLAALLCLIALLAHELIGTPMVLAPLHAVDISENVIWLHHFSWHVGTIVALTLMGMFSYASLRTEGLILAVVASLVCAAFALLAFALAIFGNAVLWTSPAPWVWSLVAMIGGFGVWKARRAQYV
ncbi:MAG: hypothetical protein AAF431_12535 [Pseudomonadota bacterium]